MQAVGRLVQIVGSVRSRLDQTEKVQYSLECGPTIQFPFGVQTTQVQINGAIGKALGNLVCRMHGERGGPDGSTADHRDDPIGVQ